MFRHTVVKQEDRSWLPGVFYNSEYQMLWADETGEKETQALLIKLNPGGFIPAHSHQGREYAYVLEGGMWAGEDYLKAGDFLTAGLHEDHEIRTEEGALFFVILEKPIEVLESERGEE